MPILYREQQMQHLWEQRTNLKLTYRTVQRGDFDECLHGRGRFKSSVSGDANFTFKGFEGRLDGADCRITDPEKAYILPAKLLALTVYKLLRNGGEEAEEDMSGLYPCL